MHAEAEAAEAIPNPMIGRRRRQFFVPDQYLDLRTISGSFCTTYFKVEQQINPVLEILFIFCTRCHRWRAYRVAKCCRVLGRPEILIFSSSHPLQSLYIFGERMSNNLAPDTQRPSDRQGNPDGVNATFFAHAVSTGRILGIVSFSANSSQLSLAAGALRQVQGLGHLGASFPLGSWKPELHLCSTSYEPFACIVKSPQVFYLKPPLKVFDAACRKPKDQSFMPTNGSIIY